MISLRQIEDPRTSDVYIEAFARDKHGHVLTYSVKVRYIDLQDGPLAAQVLAGAKTTATDAMRLMLHACNSGS